jgi:hypothetical protein
MTTHNELQTMIRATIPGTVKSMGEIATAAKASATNRLKAIELLLRVAWGPTNRPSEPSDVVNQRNARTALSRAEPFLQQIITSHKSRRIRAQAAKLADSIAKIGK